MIFFTCPSNKKNNCWIFLGFLNIFFYMSLITITKKNLNNALEIPWYLFLILKIFWFFEMFEILFFDFGIFWYFFYLDPKNILVWNFEESLFWAFLHVQNIFCDFYTFYAYFIKKECGLWGWQPQRRYIIQFRVHTCFTDELLLFCEFTFILLRHYWLYVHAIRYKIIYTRSATNKIHFPHVFDHCLTTTGYPKNNLTFLTTMHQNIHIPNIFENSSQTIISAELLKLQKCYIKTLHKNVTD